MVLFIQFNRIAEIMQRFENVGFCERNGKSVTLLGIDELKLKQKSFAFTQPPKCFF